MSGYYLVRRPPWGRDHMGPFSSYEDAVLAKTIGKRSWTGAQIMDEDEFDHYQKEKGIG